MSGELPHGTLSLAQLALRAAACSRGTYRYFGAEVVLALLAPHVSTAASVGVLGCGVSVVPEQLATAGYARVCAVDTSEVAIEVRLAAQRLCISLRS